MKIISKILIILGIFLLVGVFILSNSSSQQTGLEGKDTWWNVQSIDTVKYSRDLAREKAKEASFDEVIDQQVSLIAQTGATHVAIGTPYDDEFIGFMKRWVAAARRHGLNVWFRGNFSGWERWFGYEKITREEHIEMTKKFILANGELFEEGDIFSACTECENGGPGDPRINGDIAGHREFLIEEYRVSNDAFRKIGKNVRSNFVPMNGDVASLIMDRQTTKALGGILVIDHYVKDSEQLSNDIKALAERSGGKVVLGEFGAPIPNLHGDLDPSAQADWIENALFELSKLGNLEGINYWVGFGGSTKLWDNDSKPRLAQGILKKYYQPNILEGRVVNEIGKPINEATIEVGVRKTKSQGKGNFVIPYISDKDILTISAEGYKQGMLINYTKKDLKVVLKKKNEGIIFKVVKAVYNLFEPLK